MLLTHRIHRAMSSRKRAKLVIDQAIVILWGIENKLILCVVLKHYTKHGTKDLIRFIKDDLYKLGYFQDDRIEKLPKPEIGKIRMLFL